MLSPTFTGLEALTLQRPYCDGAIEPLGEKSLCPRVPGASYRTSMFIKNDALMTGLLLIPHPLPEDSHLNMAPVYNVTKQEAMCLCTMLMLL